MSDDENVAFGSASDGRIRPSDHGDAPDEFENKEIIPFNAMPSAPPDLRPHVIKRKKENISTSAINFDDSNIDNGSI